MKKLALLSSWKNKKIDWLKEQIPEIDDFRDRGPSFNWDDVEGDTRSKSLSPFSKVAHAVDIIAIRESHAVVLVLPCNKNAHMELGFAMALNKDTYIILDDDSEPETNYAGATGIFTGIDEFVTFYQQSLNKFKIQVVDKDINISTDKDESNGNK